jgi:hypothetical protein
VVNDEPIGYGNRVHRQHHPGLSISGGADWVHACPQNSVVTVMIKAQEPDLVMDAADFRVCIDGDEVQFTLAANNVITATKNTVQEAGHGDHDHEDTPTIVLFDAACGVSSAYTNQAWTMRRFGIYPTASCVPDLKFFPSVRRPQRCPGQILLLRKKQCRCALWCFWGVSDGRS